MSLGEGMVNQDYKYPHRRVSGRKIKMESSLM
jgi:hypothetical protein